MDPKETESTKQPSASLKPLRIWPAILFLLAMVLLRLSPSLIEDGPDMLPIVAAMGPIICSLLILIWWLTASRATGLERLMGFVGITAFSGLTFALSDESMQSPATMLVWTIPMGFAAFSIGAFAVRRSTTRKRTCIAIGIAALGLMFSLLLRSNGMWGHAQIDLYWRWTPTAEEQLLANRATNPETTNPEVAVDEMTLALENPAWPGFRGPSRNSRQNGTIIDSDWTNTSPELLWKISVGPAWSSFAVAGNLLFTQEQRGPNECVICYDAETGREIWVQEIEARFSDPLGGPGPRATPQLANGSLFVHGADGDLLKLNPVSGKIIWQTNIGETAGRKPPEWGFSSSPLVMNDVVVVHAGGEGNKGTLAFDTETGALKWSAPAGDHSYSSPQSATLAEEELVIMMTNAGMRLLNPINGEVRLNYDWPHRGYRALQPQVVKDNHILLATDMGTGTRLIKISEAGQSLEAEDIWSTRNLKADFNDFVVFDGNLYGFDGGLFACVDLDTGDRQWKGGRYGKGQVLLLEDSGLLFISSERGQGVLVKATPEEHIELATTPLLKGKTWNHPVVVGDRLFIRNAEEAACYRLPVK
jgi:outer membrane protein assembly factor BamB